MSNLVHFEVLWERAENVAADKHPSTSDNLKKLALLIKDLSAIHQTSLEVKSEIAKSLVSKTMGQILFLLTAISAKEKIDVYAALKSEYETILFQDQLEKKLGALEKFAEEVSSSDGRTSTQGSLSGSSL